MDENQKPFACTTDGCGQSFTNEDHLSVHRKKHTMQLQLSLGNKPTQFVADQTPTPTRLIRNCDEVGLFEDLHLQHVNPFDETFRRAVESKSQATTPMNLHHDDNIGVVGIDGAAGGGCNGVGGVDGNGDEIGNNNNIVDDNGNNSTSVECLSIINNGHNKTNQSSEETLHTPHVLPFYTNNDSINFNKKFFKETKPLEILSKPIDNDNDDIILNKNETIDNAGITTLESSSNIILNQLNIKANAKTTINNASIVSDSCPTILISPKRIKSSEIHNNNKHSIDKNTQSGPIKRIKYVEQKILPKINKDLQQQTLITNNTIALSNLIQVHFVTTSNTSHILPQLSAASVSTTTAIPVKNSSTNNLPLLLPRQTPTLATNINNDNNNNSGVTKNSINSKLSSVREKLKQTILKNTSHELNTLPLNGIIIDSGKRITDQFSLSILPNYKNSTCSTLEIQPKEMVTRKLTSTTANKTGKNYTDKSIDSFERNKEAAKRYRNRMRQHHIETKESNIRLELENKKLKAEIKQLKKMLLEHKNCTIGETKVSDHNFIGRTLELSPLIFKQLKIDNNNIKTMDQLTGTTHPANKTSKNISSNTNTNLDNLTSNPIYVIVNNKQIS